MPLNTRPPSQPLPPPSAVTRKPLPLLTIEPINFSLTEGTNIPAPDLETEVPPPQTKGGPLSSHPISPVDNTDESTKELPAPPANPMAPATANGNHPFRVDDQNSSIASPPSARPRKPSFVARLWGGMRSRSSLGLLSESSLNLHQSIDQNGRPTTPGSELRGIKRNAPPSSMGSPATDAYESSLLNGSERGSVRGMIRRKSMELFGSSRRKSGLWSTANASAMDEERQKELYMEEREDRRNKKPRLPMLPEMTAIGDGINGGKVGGEELFADIGR